MREGWIKFEQLAARCENVAVKDACRIFNTARIEALELDNLVTVARATIVSAIQRTESRGAHARDDYRERDDERWLKHTLYHSDGDRIGHRPVAMQPLTVETFKPKPRTY